MHSHDTELLLAYLNYVETEFIYVLLETIRSEWDMFIKSTNDDYTTNQYFEFHDQLVSLLRYEIQLHFNKNIDAMHWKTCFDMENIIWEVVEYRLRTLSK